MPRIRTFRLWDPAEVLLWRSWRARVARHEIPLIAPRNTYCYDLERLWRVPDWWYKEPYHYHDKRLLRGSRRGSPWYVVAGWWQTCECMDDALTLTKSAKE